MNLIKYLQYIVETDKTIRELLHFEVDEWTGIKYPSVVPDNVAPEGIGMPYMLIYDEVSTPNEDHEMRRLIRFEVVAENNAEAVDKAMIRLEQLFHRRNLMPYAPVSFLMGRMPKPTDAGLNGSILTIMVRQHRQDLLNVSDALPEVYIYFKIKEG